MKNLENVGIIGLGYVGAPLAYLIAFKGYNVIGIDKNEKVNSEINNRLNIPKELKKYNKQEINLIASNNYKLLNKMDVIIICVPTPTTNYHSDLSILENVVKNIGIYIKKGCLLILESTVAPGMTNNYVAEYLKNNNGLVLNEDYDLAYCPERVDPGNKKYWTGNTNRICGASSEKALKRAIEFYDSIIDGKITAMQSIEEAELVKVWENSMRNMSIAQSNLLAIICDKYNFSVKQVIKGLNSKVEQFGLSIAYPGIGPGGHCIPEDIYYLIDSIEDSNKDININLLRDSTILNNSMPQYATNKLIKCINQDNRDFKNMKILLLGISYKPNSNDIRCSKSISLYNIIKEINKNIKIYDPFAKDYECQDRIDKEKFEKYLKEVDIVIIGCAHEMFKNINYTNLKNVKYILDCWNALDKEKIVNSQIKYIGVGE